MKSNTYKVVARFAAYDDYEQRFSCEDEAREYFYYLVRFQLEKLVKSWSITLLRNSTPLASYSDYKHSVV